MSETTAAKALNWLDLPSRIKATLRVMKSARSKGEALHIWESDILAIEDALTALTSHNTHKGGIDGQVPTLRNGT